MNAQSANAVFRVVQRLACSNHRRDERGWPMGNCTECADYRAKMDAWHWAQVLAGNHDPDAQDMRGRLNDEETLDQRTGDATA